jgi:hypothetical protein
MGVCKKKQNPSNCDKMFKTYWEKHTKI